MSTLELFKMDGQCSLITGGATGLGKEMAHALAGAGSNIVVADRQAKQAEETMARIAAEHGVRSIAVQTDVTDYEQCLRAVEQAKAAFGRIDVLINNAGIVINKSALDTSLQEWHKVMDVNINGVFYMSKAVGQQMVQQQSGSIINIASMSGMIVNTPQPQASYNVSKAGVIMLTKSLAAEWADHHIRVNAIAPGYMKTDLIQSKFDEQDPMVDEWMKLTPMKRPGLPREIQGLALYLASDASSFATGGVFTMDGGYTIW